MIQNSPKSQLMFWHLLQKNLSPRTFKNSPIFSKIDKSGHTGKLVGR